MFLSFPYQVTLHAEGEVLVVASLGVSLASLVLQFSFGLQQLGISRMQILLELVQQGIQTAVARERHSQLASAFPVLRAPST
jgi:hypothetical protein